MKHKHIFIVGGAGFLGYHTSLELVDRGAQVTALAMPNEEVDDSLANRVDVVRANIDDLTDSQLAQVLTGFDAIIYAAGPDDRVELAAGVKAGEFFHTQLVERTERVLRVAKDQGVKKVIIFGSYFSYINNHGICGVKRGELERHPYIKARVEQTRRSFDLGADGFEVAVINIPYVFGVAPGKEPIWKNVFVNRFADSPKIFYGSGGSTAISAKKIAVCTAQALELSGHGEELAVGSRNMKFTPMIERLLGEANIDKPVGSLPSWILSIAMKSQWKKAQKQDLDFGLDLRYLNGDILKRNFFVDFEATDARLEIDYVDDVDEAMRETGERMRSYT